MARFYYPPAPGNGAGTFSDNLVGLQFTDGSSLATVGNFTISDSSSQQITFNYSLGGFSEPITLELLAKGNEELLSYLTNHAVLIRFNYDQDDISKLVQYGSLKERLRVATQEVINFFPAALYANGLNQINQASGNSTNNITYNSLANQTTIVISRLTLSNPFGIEFTDRGLYGIESSMNNEHIVVDEDTNINTVASQSDLGEISPLRNFSLQYPKYVLSFNGSGGTEYKIIDYTPIDDSTSGLTLVVSGAPFGEVTGTATTATTFYIKPNKLESQKAFTNLGEVERFLLNQKTQPPYTSTFKVMSQTEGGQNYIQKLKYTWPKNDLVNLDLSSDDYTTYIENLVDIGNRLDENKTDLVSRFLTTGALKEFDTGDRKVEKTLQIYGRSFDDVKKFIDGISFMTNVTYDGSENIPNKLLRNFALMLGWKTPNIIPQKDFLDTLLDSAPPQFSGQSIGLTPAELDIELYRRILMNTAFLFKSKGTRKIVEFIFELIGAPEAMVQFNEYIVLADGKFPTTIISDPGRKFGEVTYREIDYGFDFYWDKLSAGVITYPYIWYDSNIGTYGGTDYSTGETKTHGFVRGDYPIDAEGYPTKPIYNNNYYFQRGAGWYEESLEHRGEVIIDLQNSVFTGCTPIVKTKFNQFTWGGIFGNVPYQVTSDDPGAPYLERFRRFPFMPFGFGLTKKIDDKKSWVRTEQYPNLIGKVDGVPLWRDEVTAKLQSRQVGCRGIHKHTLSGETGYMACKSHSMATNLIVEHSMPPAEPIERVYDFTINRHSDYITSNEKLILNVKNTDVFINPSQAFIYDIWKLSVLSGTPFNGTPLTPSQYGWNHGEVNYPGLGGVDNTLTLLNAKDFSFKAFKKGLIETFINVKNRLTIQDGKTGGYPTLQMLFLDYVKKKNGENNEYTYSKLMEYASIIGTDWLKIMEQFIPATNLWQGGQRIENSLFHRSKFDYTNQAYNIFSGTVSSPPLTTGTGGSGGNDTTGGGGSGFLTPLTGNTISTGGTCCFSGTPWPNTTTGVAGGTVFGNSNGGIMLNPTGTTSAGTHCTLPETALTLASRAPNGIPITDFEVTCKSNYPSYYNFLGVNPNDLTFTPTTGVINNILLVVNSTGTNNLMVNQPSNLPLYPVEGGYASIITSLNDVEVEITQLLELNNSLPFDTL
jgi:hypothetical protein